ncbi:MAG: S8 family serine peptidase, partial [Deltaproteobacteria bacterium]|nr:S8 family serine peptidase [Deltaproteobacteria bacterium]
MYQKGKAKGIIKMSLFLILILLVYPASAERGTGELELKSVEATTVKTLSINNGGSGAVSTHGKTTTTSEDKDIKRSTEPTEIKNIYIVTFKEAPVASYKGDVPGLKATSIRVTGAKKLDVKSEKCQAYIKYLDKKQSDFIKKMSQVVKRSPKVVKKYKIATNGIVAELTSKEARVIEKMSGVKKVVRDWTEKVQTDAGPKWIGAEGIWDGSATGVSTKGEGVIVGVIDTGINMDHPSFSDVGGDGYDHTNPKGDGVYTGWCDTVDPNYDSFLPCNDKLIGVWSGDEDSPEDAGGHGTHTASTAAGNVLNNVTINAPTTSLTLEEPISGVAPHANIIAYNIEAEPGSGSAWGSVIIAATEQAITDGVDVINYSFGGGGGNPWVFAEHWFNVREAGIFVATSAGNGGPDPDTIGSPANAPWLMSVAASSHNRKLGNALIGLTSDSATLDNIEGEGVTGSLGDRSIVYAGDIDPDNCGCDGDYAPGTFDGEIVVCDYYSSGHAYIGRVNKSINLADAGAGGFILINNSDWASAVMVDSYAIPGMCIPFDAGENLKTWLASGVDHTGAIRGVLEEPAPGDIMAGFSSRGPNGPVPDVIKPDVTAPGRRIVAAVNTTDPSDPPEFDVYQGTSMSSPHAAGAAALMCALYPNWTPAEIQSVLMSTALNTTLKEDAATSADPFDVGAGRIDLNLAANAGLALDETPENLWNSNPLTEGDPTTLNLASLCNSNCVGGCSWTRVVRNTLDQPVTWTASVDVPSGVTLDVSPGNFTIGSNETQEIVITVNVTGMPVNEWIFGSVTFSAIEGVASDAHFPVAVLPSSSNLPDSMTIETRRNAGSQTLKDLEAIEISEMTVEVDGLAEATLDNRDLSEDPTNGDPFDNLNDGTVFYVVTNVPAGARRLVAEITT